MHAEILACPSFGVYLFFLFGRGFSQLLSSYLLKQLDWAQQQLCLFRFLHLARLFKFNAYPHRFQVRAQLIAVALTPELKSPNCFRHPCHPCRAPTDVLFDEANKRSVQRGSDQSDKIATRLTHVR